MLAHSPRLGLLPIGGTSTVTWCASTGTSTRRPTISTLFVKHQVSPKSATSSRHLQQDTVFLYAVTVGTPMRPLTRARSRKLIVSPDSFSVRRSDHCPIIPINYNSSRKAAPSRFTSLAVHQIKVNRILSPVIHSDRSRRAPSCVPAGRRSSILGEFTSGSQVA
jgi:hypothetical protein